MLTLYLVIDDEEVIGTFLCQDGRVKKLSPVLIQWIKGKSEQDAVAILSRMYKVKQLNYLDWELYS